MPPAIDVAGLIVGIDLGTSNSCVAVVGPDGVPQVLPDAQNRTITPSVVSFHPNGQVLVGHEAKQRRVIDPRNTVYSIKRVMGRRWSAPEVATCLMRSSYVLKEGPNEQPLVATRAGEFAPAEISAIVLDHMRRVASARLGMECQRAVITVPANFNDSQRQATATAGAIAELVVVRVLNEPTAAALAYGHGRDLHQTVAVYDFGGGTFDVTLLALRKNVYEVLSTAGDTFLGGDDIDSRLVDLLARAFLQQHRIDLTQDEIALQRLRAAAETCKCELSSAEQSAVHIDEIAVGAGGRPIALDFNVPRDGFIRHVADIIDRSFPVCEEAMRLAGLATTQVDEVVLVGGTTRIPYLRDRVARFFGRTPRMDVNPDEAVALGAALQGFALAGVLDRPRRPTPPSAAAERRTIMEQAPVAPGLPSLPPAPARPAPAIGRIATKKVSVPVPRSRVDDITEVNRLPPPPDETEETTLAGVAPVSMAPMLSNEQALPPARPILLDVTPRGLAVATVGGYCEEIIGRNSQIPIEQTRVFSTAKDGQASVEVKICQGESRRFDENTLIGTLVLENLPPRRRSEVKISVTFEINTDGMLQVDARDDQTGAKQSARLSLLGAQSSEEVDAARDRLRDLRG